MATIPELTLRVLKTAEVDVERLAARPGEPVRRLEHFDDLTESIAKVGLLRPIDIAPDYEIVDGHRRHQACMELGKDRIVCQFWVGADGKSLMQSEKNALYSQLNSAQRPFNGKDALASFARDSVLVGSPTTQKNIILAKDALGMSGIRKLVDAGFGPGAVSVAKMAAKRAGEDHDDKQVVAKYLWWLVKYGAQNWIRGWIDGNNNLAPIKVRALVEKDAPPPRH